MFKLFMFSVISLALIYQPQGTEASAEKEFKKLFHKLMEEIDKALTHVEGALDDAMNTVKAKASELEGRATSELENTIAPLRERLNDLVAQATAAGFDIAQCQTFVDDFSNAPNNLEHNLVDCINTQISTAQQLADDVLQNAKDIGNIKMGHCKGNVFKKAKCYIKLIKTIVEDIEKVPKHIMEDAAKATELVANIVPNLEECFVSQLTRAGDAATQDVAEFEVCAAL